MSEFRSNALAFYIKAEERSGAVTPNHKTFSVGIEPTPSSLLNFGVRSNRSLYLFCRLTQLI